MMEIDPVSEVTPTTTPDPSQENAALRGALEAVRNDYAKLQGEAQLLAKTASETQAALGSALIERDSFKEQVGKLEPVAKEAEGLKVQVQTFINTGRESALVEALRTKLPGAEPLALRGVIAQLAEQGKASRYPEDAAAEAAKVLDLINKEAPSLTRPPTSASGTSLVRPATKAGYRGPFSK
jgi:hypothetical protein